jgi:hypothetical protein
MISLITSSTTTHRVHYNNAVLPVIFEGIHFTHMYLQHLPDCIISLKEEWAHHTNTTPPLFIEVPARSQEIERSSICMLKVSTSKLIKTNGRVAGVVIVW